MTAAERLLNAATVTAVLATSAAGFLAVDHLGEARRCHTLLAQHSPAATRYGCTPKTSGRGVVEGQGEGPTATPRPVASPAGALAARQPRASRSARLRTPVRTGSPLDVTAYCATGSRTASGVWPEPGMAAGPWPFGTRLHVEGVGVVTVTDRIGWGSQLDLFKASCDEAREFGRRSLWVEEVR